MTKLVIKKNDISFDLESDYIDINALCTLVNSVFGTSGTIQESKHVEREQVHHEQIQRPEDIEERPMIRQRIPNNVIDVTTLNVQDAVTENALIRCPVCGQSHCAGFKTTDGKIQLLVRDFKNNEFNTVGAYTEKDFEIFAIKKEDADYVDFFNDLQSVKGFDDVVCADENTTIICPVCGKRDIFSSWKSAYMTPSDYFETDFQCECCGGEVIETRAKSTDGTSKQAYVCEKCGKEQLSIPAKL